MAIYLCHECDEFIDDDWDPCTEVNGELVCPACVEEMGLIDDGWIDMSALDKFLAERGGD